MWGVFMSRQIVGGVAMTFNKRCGWCGSDPVYIQYHDEEWGRRVTDDHKLFEFLVLESAQAGLSWITILKRRHHYEKAFAHFDVKKVSQFSGKDVQALLQNEGIIRNRLKITATISNARCFMEVQKEFGSFGAYLTSFLPDGRPIINQWKNLKEIPARTELSDAIAKDMKKRGFKFFGTVICYAFLQATGYVNDHLLDCPFRGSESR